MDHQQLSGSQDSSSLKPSSPVSSRTTQENIQLPLISYLSNTRCTMRFSPVKSLRNQKTDASLSVCTWRVRDGTQQAITSMNQNQSNSTQNSLSSGSCLKRIARYPKQACTDAQSTKYCHVQELSQLRAIQPISASSLNCQAEKSKTFGSEQESRFSCLSDTEHIAPFAQATLSIKVWQTCCKVCTPPLLIPYKTYEGFLKGHMIENR